VAASLALAGCGSTGTTTTATTSASTPATPGSAPPGAWTGLGAKLADWAAAHPKNSSGCEETPCYGEAVMDSGKLTPEFSGVSTTEAPAYRVDGYRQAIADGTPLAVAQSDVLRLLPSDTRPTAFFVTHSASGSCASWNLKSATLGRWFAESGPKVGDAQGALGVDFFAYNSSDEPSYSSTSVSNAIVSIAPAQKGTSC
jgi:hypothetical protein